MFTTKTPNGAMARSYALTVAAVIVQLTLPSLEAEVRPDFFDAFRNAALLYWIPGLLVVQRSIHHRFRTGNSTADGVIASTAMFAVVILAAGTAA